MINKLDWFFKLISFNLLFDKKVSKQYAVEFSGLSQIRSFEDGIGFFNFDISFDYYYGDHNPQFNVIFEILNYKIFEFVVYNVHGISWSDDELENMKSCSNFEEIKEYNELLKSIGR